MLSDDLRDLAAFFRSCAEKPNSPIEGKVAQLLLNQALGFANQATALEAYAVRTNTRDLPPGIVRLDVARIARRRGLALPDGSGGDAA